VLVAEVDFLHQVEKVLLLVVEAVEAEVVVLHHLL
jgi:hypothetical protein